MLGHCWTKHRVRLLMMVSLWPQRFIVCQKCNKYSYTIFKISVDTRLIYVYLRLTRLRGTRLGDTSRSLQLDILHSTKGTVLCKVQRLSRHHSKIWESHEDRRGGCCIQAMTRRCHHAVVATDHWPLTTERPWNPEASLETETPQMKSSERGDYGQVGDDRMYLYIWFCFYM